MDIDITALASKIVYKEKFQQNLLKFINETNSTLKINEVYNLSLLKKKVVLIGMNEDFSKFYVKVWKRGMTKKYDPVDRLNREIEFIWISRNLFTF